MQTNSWASRPPHGKLRQYHTNIRLQHLLYSTNSSTIVAWQHDSPRQRGYARANLTTKSNSNRPAEKDPWPRLKTKFQAILALSGHLILFPQLPSPISIPIHGNHSQPRWVNFTAHPQISGTRIYHLYSSTSVAPRRDRHLLSIIYIWNHHISFNNLRIKKHSSHGFAIRKTYRSGREVST